MKKILPVFLTFLFSHQAIYSQTTENTGNPVTEIFTDFHLNLNDSTKTTGFGLNRAYLGYKYTPGGNYSALVILNIGTPEDLAPGSVPKRYPFFREASITYTQEKLTLSFGMVSTRYLNFQQGFWGKRYLGAEYQALYGYGSVADLGVVVDYKFNDIFKADFSLLNGEGYTNIQVDNSLKSAVGLTVTPGKFALRLYTDLSQPSGTWQSTNIAFAGFKNNLFSIGAEASYKTNLDCTKGHDVWGLSSTGSIFLNEKSDIFIRCDYTTSVKVSGDALAWDCIMDATYFIGGFQRIFSNNLKMALSYRITDPHFPGKKTTDAIYLNARFCFL